MSTQSNPITFEERVSVMPEFTIRVSQRVFYDVSVEAPTRIEALRQVVAAIESVDPKELGLDSYCMTEVDSGEFEVEPVQVDANGDPVTDEQFLEELLRLTKDLA